MKTKTVHIRFFLTMLISALIPSLTYAAIHTPQLQIPYIKTAPVIDGNLNDQAWKKSTELSEFINWSLDSYIKDAVTVYLCYDDKNLYVAFRNADPAASDLNRTVSQKGPWDTFLWGRKISSVSFIQVMCVRFLSKAKMSEAWDTPNTFYTLNM